MKHKILGMLTMLLLIATTASAMTLDGSCDIRFFGESTLHGFDGKVACQPFALNSEESATESGVIPQPMITVLVGEMSTDNSHRDKKMYAMFEQGKYPQIEALFNDLDQKIVLQQLESKTDAPGNLEFVLRIREISQRVQAVARELEVTPEQISFVLEFPLSLESFQLKPPSVLGIIKVDDRVQVEVKVLLLRH